MAIEDAAALSQALFSEPMARHLDPVPTFEIAARLNQYAAKRWQRNARVQARALRNGRIFHATGALQWSRDAAMRLLGEPLLDLPWLYRGDC